MLYFSVYIALHSLLHVYRTAIYKHETLLIMTCHKKLSTYINPCDIKWSSLLRQACALFLLFLLLLPLWTQTQSGRNRSAFTKKYQLLFFFFLFFVSRPPETVSCKYDPLAALVYNFHHYPK